MKGSDVRRQVLEVERMCAAETDDLAVPEERSQSFAAALEDLHNLSAEVLRQAEEDRRLFGL